MTTALTDHIDFFLGLFAFIRGSSGLYLRLFQASITLAAFTSVVLIFRYQRIDTYIDNQKSVLKDLLNWTHDPHALGRIRNIGMDKHPPEQNDKNFFGKDKEATQRFVADILELMKKKKISLRFGVISIILWVILSLGCLIGYYCLSGHFYYYAAALNAAKIAVTFFYLNLVFTFFTLIYTIQIY